MVNNSTNDNNESGVRSLSDSERFKEFQPADEYDGYYALLHGAGTKVHVVDTTTFGNGGIVRNPDGSDYEGYTANVGKADTLCGHELLGRMCPLDTERGTLESRICGTCLRSVNTESERSGGGVQ